MPGSGRDNYVEKNRGAASKCRNKQRQQQEDLIKETRNCECKNKLLKAEVELLKSDMRDLLDKIGKHSDRPDARLWAYVQREADRLAAGNNPIAELLLPRNCSSSAFD